MVRQLFEAGVFAVWFLSMPWRRTVLLVYIQRNLVLKKPAIGTFNNDIDYIDSTGLIIISLVLT
jgi:hypothetical protein